MVQERFRLIPVVILLLVKDGKVLLLRRSNTGFEDGMYGSIGGHVEGEESIISAIIRETKEEVGINISPKDLRVFHVMHQKCNEKNEERVCFFLTTDNWTGEVKIMEPHKCDDLRWFSTDNLPHNIIPHVKAAIGYLYNNTFFSEDGW